ncbi:MAG TPA: hypothetical protein VMM56_16680 [Planctomycetaceae bacterium]|nr:hypothetical protein [Planctomycetaceae bacterium]
MSYRNRREFLSDVGRGMLVAGLGSATAFELGLARGFAEEPESRLTFGPLEPLVSLMQESPLDKLLSALVQKLESGVDLKTLVSSAALANARAFGGEDYTGYHTFMALVPAYQMAGELPKARQALPVLKVLYRNTSRIQETGSNAKDVLHPIEGEHIPDRSGQQLLDAIHSADLQAAENQFAGLVEASPKMAYNNLQQVVQEEVNVHRVVLAWRAWAMLDLTGDQFAHTMLRQSVRFCIDHEQELIKRKATPSAIRTLVPKLLDQYRLLEKPLGKRKAEDRWIEELAQIIFSGTRDQAAEAVAAALAEGIDPEDIGEAMSIAANLLVLHDPGRLEKYSNAQKPPGCVHGDSVGVHASDAANAWRCIARVSNPRNTIASLIVGAYHTAGQTAMVTKEPYPFAKRLDDITSDDPAKLLHQAEEAIQTNDQALACAVAHRYGELNLSSRPMFDLMLKYAVSEDGALHAEKYYRTVSEEFAQMRDAFRWREVVALARVTASEHGFAAPGYSESCDLLGLT